MNDMIKLCMCRHFAFYSRDCLIDIIDLEFTCRMNEKHKNQTKHTTYTHMLIEQTEHEWNDIRTIADRPTHTEFCDKNSISCWKILLFE